MSQSTIVAACLAALALAACPTTGSSDGGTTSSGGSSGGQSTASGSSSGGSSSGGGSSGGIPLDQILAEETQALCQFNERCNPSAAYVVSGCPAYLQQLSLPGFDQALAELDAGLVAYDPQAAQACLQALAAAPCGTPVASLPACQAIIVGQVASGGSCYSNAECHAGSCSALPPSTCPGFCTAYSEDGGPCGGPSMAECDPSRPLSCSFSSGGFCIVQPGVGQSCQTVGCQAGLTCVGDFCLAPSSGGGPCTTASSCQSGFYCPETGDESCTAQVGDGGFCNEGPSVSLLAGEPGYAGGECAAGLVCAGYVVGGGAVAAHCLPPTDVGQACITPPSDAGATVSGCLYGLACLDGGCQLPPSSGPCGPDPAARCLVYSSYCDPTTDSCQPLGTLGSDCTPALFGADCATGNCDANSRQCSLGAPLCAIP